MHAAWISHRQYAARLAELQASSLLRSAHNTVADVAYLSRLEDEVSTACRIVAEHRQIALSPRKLQLGERWTSA